MASLKRSSVEHGEELQDVRVPLASSLTSLKGEMAARQANEFFSDVIAATRDPLIVLDADLRVILVNQAFSDTFQISPENTVHHLLCELSEAQWDIPGLRSILEDVLSGKKANGDFEVSRIFPRVGYKALLLNARQILHGDVATGQILLSVQDVTQRRQSETSSRAAEELLQQNSRLASIGLLTTGITHELNNPLGIIMGYSELALGEVSDERVRSYLETIYDATERAARIVDSVLTFAGGRQSSQSVVEVHSILNRVIGLMSRDMAFDGITVTEDFSADTPSIFADPFQLVEVFVNILTNAQQAMVKAHGHGAIVVHTAVAHGRVRISIEDNGPGIELKNQGQVFDPFFTTKDIGEGTGLGLSIAYGIVHGHDGEISVESDSGKGTTFHIDLPIVDAASPVEQASVALTADHDRLKESSGKGKRVLVVNNEPAFRDLLTITLSADGHTVDRANDGEDAWNMIHRQDYDRILVNLWMPRMGGQKLYELIYDYSHELARKCIFITGASAGDDTHDFIAATGNPSLSKPFPLAEVRRLVLEPLRPG